MTIKKLKSTIENAQAYCDKMDLCKEKVLLQDEIDELKKELETRTKK